MTNYIRLINIQQQVFNIRGIRRLIFHRIVFSFHHNRTVMMQVQRSIHLECKFLPTLTLLLFKVIVVDLV